MPAPTTMPDRFAAARLWTALWRGLAARDRRRLKVAAVAMLLGSILTALVPVIVGGFVDAVLKDDASIELSTAVTPLLILAGALTGISALEVIRHQLVHMVTTSFQSDARQRIYAAVMRWDLVRYVDGARGAIYGRANRSVDGAERLIKLGAADLLPAITVAVFAIAFALARYGLIGLVMAIVVPTGLALVLWQVRSQNGIRVEVARAKERIDGDVSAWLGLLDVIRTTGTEFFFNDRVREACLDLRARELQHHIAMSKFDAAKTVNEAIWLVVTLVAAIELRPDFTAGELTGLVLLYLAVTKPLRELHRVIDEGAESALQARDLIEDLQAPHDASYGTTSPVAAAAPAPDNAALVLRNVAFQHGDGHEATPVLRGVSTTIARGERVGIVGTTGCGKSTLLKILARLLHNASGEILIEGRPLESVPRNELVGILGYVSQQPLLFRGTVRENLLMGRQDIRDDELARACSRAHIHPEILRMPRGYDTIIGEDGAKLSGGQRQRLCLARALVRTPPIMLLDEPTSALDGPSQTAVQEAIDKLDDVTMLIVAHRLQTLRNMDRIIVLDNGKIVEQGAYHDLEIADGVFSAMLVSERRGAGVADHAAQRHFGV
jgi:ATP-binding cassette subfamily B protein